MRNYSQATELELKRLMDVYDVLSDMRDDMRGLEYMTDALADQARENVIEPETIALISPVIHYMGEALEQVLDYVGELSKVTNHIDGEGVEQC